MSEKSHKKYHDPCVLFLDDCFSNDDVATALKAEGFTVEEFTTHFPRSEEEPLVREQGVKDPRVIALSHRKGWLILTNDQKMKTAHEDVFVKNQNAMVLATSNNNDGDEIWVQAVILAKTEIERKVKKQPRPWCAQINRQGQITSCHTMTEEGWAKRKRKRK